MRRCEKGHRQREAQSYRYVLKSVAIDSFPLEALALPHAHRTALIECAISCGQRSYNFARLTTIAMGSHFHFSGALVYGHSEQNCEHLVRVGRII